MSLTRQPNPVWLFTDLTGDILDDTYYMSFLQNDIPYLPQPVYTTSQGSLGGVWPNPLQFSPDGTLPDNMYWAPGVYRLEIRQGDASSPSQSDPLIRLIENYVVEGEVGPDTEVSLPTPNQAINGSFVLVSFSGTLVITNTGANSYDIAPGWMLNVDSSGQVVINVQQIPVEGLDASPINDPTNPSYVLEIAVISGTITTLELTQRFNHAPSLWAQEGVSVDFTGKVNFNTAIVTVVYRPSSSTDPDVTLLSATLGTSFEEFSDGELIPPSTSTDFSTTGYVDIVFELPLIGTTFLSNIQIIASDTPSQYRYIQQSVEQQINQTFSFYREALLRQPKSNLLVGWTFALNPWQFRTTSSTNLANNDYTADQTIIVQQGFVFNATGNNIAVGTTDETANYAYQVVAVTANNKFAMIQYIDPSTIAPYWGKTLSAMVNAYITTAHATACRVKCVLIYKAGLPLTISQMEPIATWDSAVGAEPVMASGWNILTTANNPIYTLTATDGEFVWDGFELPASSDPNMTLGIMIYTLDNMSATSVADSIQFDRVSLVQNDFAIDASPETFDENLRKCQFYYEKSYQAADLPGTITKVGSQVISHACVTNNSVTNSYRKRISLNYKQIKRVTPTTSFYSTLDGAINRIMMTVVHADNSLVTAETNQNISLWTLQSSSPSTVTYFSNTGSPFSSDGSAQIDEEAIMQYQYVADARLGKI